MRSIFIIIFALLGPLLFTACSTMTDSEFQAGKAAAAGLSKCTASGKIAIKQDNKRLSSIFYVNLDDPAYELSLTGITGSTIFRLESTPSGAVVIDEKGNKHTGSNADDLVKKLTNLSIPCSRLPDILRGLSREDSGQSNEEFSYGDYVIKYDSYRKEGAYTLPERVTITGKNLNIRIHITKWVL